MRLLHSLARTRASFDDPNLVSHAGLVPVMALAQRAGLTELVAEHVTPGGECGVNADSSQPTPGQHEDYAARCIDMRATRSIRRHRSTASYRAQEFVTRQMNLLGPEISTTRAYATRTRVSTQPAQGSYAEASATPMEGSP